MKNRKTKEPKADVHIDNSTFNAPTQTVQLDATTASAISALAHAIERNADALISVAGLIKGGDSIGLFVGTNNKTV